MQKKIGRCWHQGPPTHYHSKPGGGGGWGGLYTRIGPGRPPWAGGDCCMFAGGIPTGPFSSEYSSLFTVMPLLWLQLTGTSKAWGPLVPAANCGGCREHPLIPPNPAHACTGLHHHHHRHHHEMPLPLQGLTDIDVMLCGIAIDLRAYVSLAWTEGAENFQPRDFQLLAALAGGKRGWCEGAGLCCVGAPDKNSLPKSA